MVLFEQKPKGRGDHVSKKGKSDLGRGNRNRSPRMQNSQSFWNFLVVFEVEQGGQWGLTG